MADEDQEKSQPSLELPKLFGRKKQPEPAPEPDADPEAPAETEVISVDEPTEVIQAEPASAEPEPGPQPEPAPAAKTQPAEAGAPLFADEAAEKRPAPVKVERRPQPPREPRTAKLRESLGGLSAPSIPELSGYVAAAVTGVVVGLVTVGATAGSLQTCEAVRGTSSCGGAGVWLLIAILLAMTMLGATLLRLFGVPDPGSSSFLAVGMVAVIALLFLLDVILSWWMLIVIPAVSAAMYMGSYWITTTFVEPAKD